MRKSVKKNDPGYEPIAHRYEVFLDGERIEHCYTADEELGLAWCYNVDPRDVVGDELPTVVKRGKVEIRLCKQS